MANIHRITRLSVTPVKGLQLHHPSSIELTANGVAGDRTFVLVDENGRLQSCTHNQRLLELRAAYDPARCHLTIRRGSDVVADGVIRAGGDVRVDLHGLRSVSATEIADSSWSKFFSDLIDKPVRLLRALEPAFDVQPATLIGTASSSELARRSCLGNIDARRFRMLIEFDTDEPHVEDSWDGAILRAGSAVLRGGGPVKRCAATTRNPEHGEIDLHTLRMITAYRGRRQTVLGPGATFGTYAEVLEPGTINVSDTLSVMK
ncbi:MOSC N-terminal beta barrel domain-containing protein [Nocardioides sp.]|uniref:MOSC domain-containing protein n=1 Tax=Nocardioides sp. TaxID=35761 RepID=UPI0019AC7606|nr:MOSC N-terminal beta barrel domain-containing protein [Nocardioides sp.]MBC7279192.1 MOSC N-terminal beta barrel domain-containing protein [Nocardioides sp.]